MQIIKLEISGLWYATARVKINGITHYLYRKGLTRNIALDNILNLISSL